MSLINTCGMYVRLLLFLLLLFFLFCRILAFFVVVCWLVASEPSFNVHYHCKQFFVAGAFFTGANSTHTATMKRKNNWKNAKQTNEHKLELKLHKKRIEQRQQPTHHRWMSEFCFVFITTNLNGVLFSWLSGHRFNCTRKCSSCMFE